MQTTYRLAGIDVHKKMLAVVVTDVAEGGEFRFERGKFACGAEGLSELVGWFGEREVKEAVMESTAQYWKPVWQALEDRMRLHLAQAHSNKAPGGRKRDFSDAERLVRRHVAGELILSFVPAPEQRLWRTLTRGRQQLIGHRRSRNADLILDKADHPSAPVVNRVRLQNQLEGYLEEMRIKLSSHVSDLPGPLCQHD